MYSVKYVHLYDYNAVFNICRVKTNNFFSRIIETDKTYNTHVPMNIHILIEKPFLNSIIEIKLLCKM